MTTELFKKLNLKDQKELVILNAPPEFELELTALSGLEIRRQLKAGKPVDFLLAFQTRKADVEALLPKLAEAARGDAVLWLVYPGHRKNPPVISTVIQSGRCSSQSAFCRYA